MVLLGEYYASYLELVSYSFALINTICSIQIQLDIFASITMAYNVKNTVL